MTHPQQLAIAASTEPTHLNFLMTTVLVIVVVVKSGLTDNIEMDITLSDRSLLHGALNPTPELDDGQRQNIDPIECYCSYPEGIRFHENFRNNTQHKIPCWRGGFVVKKVSCSAQLGCFNITVTNKTITSKWGAPPPYFIQNCFWNRKNNPDWSKANECKEAIGEGNGCVCNTSMCNGNAAAALSPFSLSFLLFLPTITVALL